MELFKEKSKLKSLKPRFIIPRKACQSLAHLKHVTSASKKDPMSEDRTALKLVDHKRCQVSKNAYTERSIHNDR